MQYKVPFYANFNTFLTLTYLVDDRKKETLHCLK